MLTPFERGLVAHLVADWLLQNDWMALNKMNLRHPAGWVHAAIHGLLLGLALGWAGGVALGILHLLLDTGRPLNWWIRVFKKMRQRTASRAHPALDRPSDAHRRHRGVGRLRAALIRDGYVAWFGRPGEENGILVALGERPHAVADRFA